MRRDHRISTARLDTPFAVPMPHFAVESALSERRDHQSALAIRRIGLDVAVSAEGNELVEVEV